MSRHVLSALAAAALLTAAAPALAQHGGGQTTADLQGGGQKAFMDSPQIHAFYDLSRKTLGHGAVPEAEIAAYEQKSYALFRELGAHMGMTPAQMQDHLKLIPRQVVQIVKDDPHALDSYQTFTEALVGPP